jgi:transposase
MAMAIVETRPITGGVDTHLEVNVAAALDASGGVLGVESFPTTPAGFAGLYAWLAGFGPVDRVGVEGTGAYGAGLSRHLRAAGLEVIEVGRPNRQVRRQQGKSDTVDAVEAGRAVLSGRASGVAQTADGNAEAMRALLVAKRSGARPASPVSTSSATWGSPPPTSCGNASGTCPGPGSPRPQPLRPRADSDPVLYATKLAMRTLGRRVLTLVEDTEALDAVLAELVTVTAPSLLELYGVGVHTAAILLVAAGDNAERVRSEAAWAHLYAALQQPGASVAGGLPVFGEACRADVAGVHLGVAAVHGARPEPGDHRPPPSISSVRKSMMIWLHGRAPPSAARARCRARWPTAISAGRLGTPTCAR